MPREATNAASHAPPAPPSRKVENRLIVFAVVGTLLMVPAAFYTVHITTTRLVQDQKLSFDEARYWARSARLSGLTLAEAQPLVEGPLTPAPDAPQDALVTIHDDDKRVLRLSTSDGRIVGATIEELPAPRP